MTIRRTFHVVYGALMVLAIALAALSVLLFLNQRRFVASEENRFTSFVLAEELRQSGEHLTQFARAYVATGEEQFRQDFRDVVAIRNGDKPLPVHYERIYWDYIAAGRPFPRGYAPAVPLLTLMRQAGVTDAEFAKLAQAEANSDALTRREDSAMYARDGLYDDGAGHFTRRGRPDVALAIRLTHDQAYHNAIADVRIPIDEFFGMLDARTGGTVAEYSRRARAYLYAILSICGIMIALKLATFPAARRRIWTPVAALQNQAQDVASDLQRLSEVTASIVRGELDKKFVTQAQLQRVPASDEIGQLMHLHDVMIGRLQDTGDSIATLTARQTVQFEQLFEQAPEGIALLDADDRVVRINGEFTRLFGYGPDEVAGRPINDLVVPDGVSDGASQTKVRSLRNTHGRVSFDAVRRHKNGSLLHVSVLGVPVDVAPADIHGLAIYRDVTEREETRAALARQAALRVDVHSALSRGTDLHEMLQGCTQAAVDHLGAAFARIWVRHEHELVLQASAGLYTRLDGSHSRIPVGQWKIGRIAQEKRPHATNDVVHDPQVHDTAWAVREGMVAFAGYPLLVGDRVLGVLAMFFRNPIGPGTLDTLASIADTIAQGIQRKQAEQALQESERSLRQVIETIPDLVWSAAPDGSVDHVNQRVLAYNGKTLDDLPNDGWLSVIHPDDVEGAANAWMHSVATGESYATEFRHRRFDGAYRWFSSRALPLRDSTGRIVRWYGLLSDIEERRNAVTALLEARAELAHVTRTTTMGEFAASIAHEVNQPLAAVVANAGACRRWLGRKEPDLQEAKAALQRIARDGKRASDVIARMRGLLQQSPTEFTDVDLARIVREVLELVGPEVTRQRVALRRSLTAGLAPVRGDQVQLQQVVLNLITNAIQAMSGVRDRPRELRIGVTSGTFDQRPGQTVSVGDSGLGFAPAEVGKLFQAFYTTKPGGLGMGLAISRSIIEAHGGRLWASANPDYGATFQFAVPLGG